MKYELDFMGTALVFESNNNIRSGARQWNTLDGSELAFCIGIIFVPRLDLIFIEIKSVKVAQLH
jgi:hypothetical protein